MYNFLLVLGRGGGRGGGKINRPGGEDNQGGGKVSRDSLLYIGQGKRGYFMFSFLSCVCYAFVRVCLYVPMVTCWERADLLALVCGV